MPTTGPPPPDRPDRTDRPERLDPPARTERTARRRRRAGRALRGLLVAASLVLLARVAVPGADGVGDALALLWQQQPAAIAGVLAIVAAWLVALAEVQRASARSLGVDLSRRDALRISRAAFTLSRVVPGGGAAGGVFAVGELVRLGHPAGLAGATAVVSWAVTATVFAGVVVVAAGLVVGGGLLPVAAVAPAVAGLLGLAGAGALVLRAVRDERARRWLRHRLAPPSRRRSAGRAAAIADRARAAGAATVADLDAAQPSAGSRAAALGWAAAAYLLEATLLWAVFAAVGTPLPPAVVAAGFLSAGVLNTVPELTPGWIGVYEATMAATYTALGVPADAAVTGVLVHRLVAFWLPVAVGVVPAVRSLAARRRDTAVPTAVPARVARTATVTPTAPVAEEVAA